MILTAKDGKSVWDLTIWGRVTHIFVNKINVIVPYNGLSPGRRQAIMRTISGILLIGPLGTILREIVIEIHAFFIQEIVLEHV